MLKAQAEDVYDAGGQSNIYENMISNAQPLIQLNIWASIAELLICWTVNF